MPKYDISKFYSFYYKETDLLHFFSMADHKSWGVKLGMHNLFELKHEEDNMELWSLLNFGDFGVLQDGEIGCAFGFEMFCKF